jgi:hypothetical protein
MKPDELEARVAKLEQQVDVLTRALHLTLVAAEPAGNWLDANMAKIDKAHEQV